MAGPVAEILLRRPTSTAEAFDLASTAGQALGLTAQAPPSGEAQAVARVPLPNGYEFSIWLVPADHERDEGEGILLAQQAGYRPGAGLQVVSWTRNSAVARLQAALLIELARAGDEALIELGGPITPPGFRRSDDFGSSTDAVRRYVDGRPGVIREVPYGLAVGGAWIYHLVDSGFLSAWLEDPHFHLPN